MSIATHQPLLPFSPLAPEAVLSVRDITLSVRLGVPPDERSVPQSVCVHIDMIFMHMPACASSDDINDTICYDTLTTVFLAAVAGKEFKLIETLCGTLCGAARCLVPLECGIVLQALKVNPPVDAISGGAAFTVHCKGVPLG